MRTRGLALVLGSLACGVAGCPDGGVPADAFDARAVDSAAPDAPAPTACAPATGSGTRHTAPVMADETWTAATGPHVVPGNLGIHAGTLTIESCAVVRVGRGGVIDIGGTPGSATAAVVARGDVVAGVRRPVRFERDDPAAPWGSLRAFATGRIDLERVDLAGGGDPATAVNLGGTLIATGEGGTTGLTRNLRTVDVRVEGSGGFGVNLQARGAFTDDSAGLVVRGAGALPGTVAADTRFPVYVEGAAVSTIPAGEYTGNAADEVFVTGASSLTDDAVTFRARGVPYRLASSFGLSPLRTAAQGGLSTLTLEAGTTLRFARAATSVWSLNLGSSSGATPDAQSPVRLIADGTAAAPIVLTSAEAAPRAGDWGGIEWHAGPAAGNVMRFVRVTYAGGDSGTSGFGCGPGDNDAALIFRNWRPDDAFLQQCTFEDSGGGGIVSGWTSDAAGPDLRAGNAFARIANGCLVSRWAARNGTCPGGGPSCL